MENGCQKQPKLHSSTGKSFSAPARLCPDDSASSKQLITSWRFVNKYEHRSNGGIPIFSEERLQERKGVKCMRKKTFYALLIYAEKAKHKLHQ